MPIPWWFASYIHVLAHCVFLLNGLGKPAKIRHHGFVFFFYRPIKSLDKIITGGKDPVVIRPDIEYSFKDKKFIAAKNLDEVFEGETSGGSRRSLKFVKGLGILAIGVSLARLLYCLYETNNIRHGKANYVFCYTPSK